MDYKVTVTTSNGMFNSTPCLRERVLKCLKRGKNKVRSHTKKVNVVVKDGVEMTQRKEI